MTNLLRRGATQHKGGAVADCRGSRNRERLAHGDCHRAVERNFGIVRDLRRPGNRNVAENEL